MSEAPAEEANSALTQQIRALALKVRAFITEAVNDTDTDKVSAYIVSVCFHAQLQQAREDQMTELLAKEYVKAAAGIFTAVDLAEREAEAASTDAS